MKKKYLIITLVLLIGIILGACTTAISQADQTRPIKIWKQNENGSYTTLCIVDEDTGVNYIVVSQTYSGSHTVSVSVTPRLDSDGSLYITK